MSDRTLPPAALDGKRPSSSSMEREGPFTPEKRAKSDDESSPYTFFPTTTTTKEFQNQVLAMDNQSNVQEIYESNIVRTTSINDEQKEETMQYMEEEKDTIMEDVEDKNEKSQDSDDSGEVATSMRMTSPRATSPRLSIPSTSPSPSDFSSGDMNTGTYTMVNFTVKAETRFGEAVYCSGASLIMGQFNPNESIALTTTPEEYPLWTTVKPLILPRGVPHRYMYALFSGGVFSTWEPIDCERVVIPEGREMIIKEEFGMYDETMALAPVPNSNDSSSNTVRIYERTSTEEGEAANPLESNFNDFPPSSGTIDLNVQESIPRSISQHFRQIKNQSRYKRYMESNFQLDPNGHLLLVCYHLPVKLVKSKDDQRWTAEWNRDSLISRSDESIAETMNVQWIGCVTQHQTHTDDDGDLTEQDKVDIKQILGEMGCIPVFVDRELAVNHYQGYCKGKLWPMFHNVDILDIYTAHWDRTQNVEFKEAQNNGMWWDAFQTVNLMVAKVVASLCGTNTTVWVHDYHLQLLPRYVASIQEERKQARPKMVFFLHVPFPTSEIFRELSHGPQLLEGILAVDVVGFHSFDHARHFLNACKRSLGLTYQSRRGGNLGVDYHGRNVVITISHIGIEKSPIRHAVESEAVQAKVRRYREKHPGRIIIAGVDAAQRLSGIPLKLLAFEQYLNMCPAWKDKVVLVQRCSYSRSREGDQAHSCHEIRELVARITSKHGPSVIDYEETPRSLPFEDRIALWLASDVMMLTPIREGLNLRPLEYVYAKGITMAHSSPQLTAIKPSKPHNGFQEVPKGPRLNSAGVVILSEFSACCCVLNGALRINPWSITEVVNSLDQALTMSEEERMGRRARDLPYITKQPAANWTRQVLAVLHEAGENEEEEEYTEMGYVDMETGRSHVLRVGDRVDFKQLNISGVLQAYKSSRRRVFLVDYGGTIIGREKISMYMKKDFTAISGKSPSPRMLESLRILCKDPKNTIFVISGISKTSLVAALGQIRGLGLAVENGAFYSWDNRDRSDVGVASKPRTWHEHSFKFNWEPIKALVDPILKAYCTRTNGSVIIYMDSGIAWNIRSTDPEWGLLQANSLQNDLEEVLKDLPVTIVRKKGLLEIVPEGLNKGVVARNILAQEASHNGGHHPDFLFCIGDDTTDESMFKAVYDYYGERSEATSPLKKTGGFTDATSSIFEKQASGIQHLFTCTVGKKPSHAHLYVNGVEDVEDLFQSLAQSSAKYQ